MTNPYTPPATWTPGANNGLLYDAAGNIVGAANPLAVGAAPSAANFAPSQVSVAATATLIVAARSGRLTITVTNMSTTAVYLGGTSGVTTGTGLLLPGTVGATITLAYSGALYGIVATGTENVNAYELY